MPAVRAFVAAAAVVAATAGLTGCGGSSFADRPAAEIYRTSHAALVAAHSLHASGSTSDSGQRVDVDLSIAGANRATATATFPGPARLQIVRDGGDVYLRGDEAFWARYTNWPAGRMAKVWIKAKSTATRGFGQLAAISDLNRLFASFKSSGPLTKTGEKTVDGRHVVGVKDSSGNVLYVDEAAPHYPVELSVAGSSAETVHFDKFGATFAVSPPAKSIPEDQIASYAVG